jgi:hypothetical protein
MNVNLISKGLALQWHARIDLVFLYGKIKQDKMFIQAAWVMS